MSLILLELHVRKLWKYIIFMTLRYVLCHCVGKKTRYIPSFNIICC